MNSRIQSFIDNYEEALVLVELRKQRILEELASIENPEEQFLQVVEIYWNEQKIFQVSELCEVLGMSKWEFLRLLKDLDSNQKVVCSCIDCGKERTRKARSRSDLTSVYGKSFVCEDCKKKREQRSEEYWTERRNHVEALRALPYEEYLQTDHWKSLRLQKLRQARYRCQLCNSSKPLQVHHRTYENKGQENFSDLIVLCEGCHANFHSTSGIVQ